MDEAGYRYKNVLIREEEGKVEFVGKVILSPNFPRSRRQGTMKRGQAMKVNRFTRQVHEYKGELRGKQNETETKQGTRKGNKRKTSPTRESLLQTGHS